MVAVVVSPRIVASRILLAGPAREIRAMSVLGFLKLWGSKLTGLPQPKPKNNSIRVPIGSRWARGFRVTLFCDRGVGSPSLSAVRAWANS